MFAYTKQPGETIVGIGIDFSARLATGETLTAHTVTCNSAGFVSASEISGTKVLATITGGSDGNRIKLTYRCTTSAGQVLEDEIMVVVKEV